MCIRHAYFVKHRPARWSCCKNESQKGGAGPWTRRAQARSSARLFCLGNFFFLPTSSLLLPSINPTARSPHGACPNPLPPETIQHQKKNLLIRRHLLVSALAQRDPQAPDASVESAKARIFSPRLRSKSQGLSAHRLAAAFVRKPPFPFLFFGSEPDNIFLDRKKRKHSTMLCLKITTLRAAPTISKPLISVSFQSLAAAFGFLVQGCVCTLIIPKQPASYFPYFTFEMQFGFYCIYSQLVGSDYFTLFS